MVETGVYIIRNTVSDKFYIGSTAVTQETKEKIRRAHLGKRKTKEHRQALSISHKGKKLSDQHRKSISIATSGEGNPRAKLNENKVRRIKIMLKEGYTQQSLADKFGVYQTVISGIARGKVWPNVI
jgi:ribosome-binding protein aMBF1 (putative translation factor)